MKKAIVLGGGLAGLRLAWQLLARGFQVEVYEREKQVGGLLETFRCDGFYFDLGPHVYFDEHVADYRELIGKDIRPVKAYYGVGFRGRHLASPVRPLELLGQLGSRYAVPLAWETLLRRLLKVGSRRRISSAEEWVTSHFGRISNAWFFRDYIPKVTGVSSTRVSEDWGTERHRFYQEHNIGGRSTRQLWRALGRLGRNGGGLSLWYPREGACQIPQAIARLVERQGGRIHLRANVKTVALSGLRVESVRVQRDDGQVDTVRGDVYASTLPITDLFRLLEPFEEKESSAAVQALRFRSLWLFYLIIERPRLTDKVQIYFPEERYVFKRIYEPKNLDPAMGDGDTTGICVEVCYEEGDDITRQTEGDLLAGVLRGVEEFYGVRRKEVRAAFSRKVPYAYAVYEKGYREALSSLAHSLFRLDNLVSFGRQGSFRYNHMTNRVLEASDRVAEFLGSGRSKQEFLGAPDAKEDFF